MWRFFFFILSCFSGTLLAQSYGNEWIDYDRTYYEITIEQDGWVHIPQSTLVSLGLPTDASLYQLHTGGKETALYVSTQGEMSENDFIAFLGEKNDGAFDTQLYKESAHQPGKDFSLFSQSRKYYLSVNPEDNLPLRYKIAEGTDQVTTERFYNTSVLDEYHNVFNPGKPFNIGGFENTFSEFDEAEGYVSLMIEDGFEQSQFVVTREPYYENGGQAEINIKVVGRSNDPFEYFDHHLNIELNDQYCNSIVYPGYERAEVSFPVPISQIELISRFKFSSVGDLAEEKDRSSLVSIEVKYPRHYRFDESDNFPIIYTDEESHDFRAFGLETWTNPHLLDPQNNTLNKVHERNGKQFFHIDSSNDQATRREAWFIDPNKADQILAINNLQARNFIDYSLAENQGDYILLSNEALDGSEIDAYVEYRNSEAGGAHKVSKVWVDELYDQFAHGIENHPLSIRNFVNYAVDTWEIEPQHLLLVGKSLDYRHLTTQVPDEFFVPTYGYPPSDFLLTTRSPNNHVPQLAVGRIPVRNKSQIQDYLNKVIEIEALSYNDCDLEARSWTKNVFHAVSGNNQTESDYFVSFLNELVPLIESSTMGAEVLRTLIQSGSQIEIQEDIPGLFEDGIALISFMGHPTTEGTVYWNFDIDAPELYNNPGRYPIINANSCFSGNIHHNGNPVMAEDYVLAANRGAIGYIAIVNFGWPLYMQPFNLQLYEQLGNEHYGGELGKAIQAAYASVYLDAQINSFDISAQLKQLHALVYAGDPALRTFSHPKPDYHIEASLASVSPTTLTTSQDSFLLKLNIENTGRGVGQDLELFVERIFPDGSTEIVFDEAIAAPSGKLIKTIPIENSETQIAGINQFLIRLDPNNAIDELCEANNELLYETFIENQLCPELSLEILDFPEVHCIDGVPNLLNATPPGGLFYINEKLINYHAPAEWGAGSHFLEYVYTDPASQCVYSAQMNYSIQGALSQSFLVQQSACINTPTVVSLQGIVQDGVEYQWNFGPAADIQEAIGPGPHLISFSELGANLVNLSLVKDGCSFDMSPRQVFVEEPLTPVSIVSTNQSGNTVTIELETDNLVNYYTVQVNGESSWHFFHDSTFVIEDLEPETEYFISITPLGNFTAGNNCGSGIPSNGITVSTTTCSDIDITIDGLSSLYCSEDIIDTDIFSNPFGARIWGTGVEEVIPGSMSYRFYPDRAGVGTHIISQEYFDEVTGCQYFKEHEVRIAMSPLVRISGDSVVCEGSESLLIAQTGFADYQWNGQSQESNVLQVSEAGNYELTIIDTNGCSDSGSVEIVESNTTAPQIDLGENIMMEDVEIIDTFLDAGDAASHLWSTGETTQSIYAEPGFYHVVAYNEANCPARDSISIEYIVSGIEHSDEFDLSLSPNPVLDYLQINASAEISALSIYDLQGRTLYQETLDPSNEKRVAISHLPRGYFVLEIVCNGKRIRKKLFAIGE